MKKSMLLEEPADLAVCSSCQNRIFGRAFRLWNNPKKFGNRIIYQRTDIKICISCKHDLNINTRLNHERRSNIHSKRRRG